MLLIFHNLLYSLCVSNGSSWCIPLDLKSLMNQSLLATNMTLPDGVYEDVVSAIGHTPLIRLNKVTADLSAQKFGLNSNVAVRAARLKIELALP